MGLRPLHKNLLPSAGLASFLGHGCLSGTWTRMLLARLQGRHTMGAQGWLLQWSVRWLPGPCLVAQRNQESQSRTLTLLQLTSSALVPLVCLLVNSPHCLHCHITCEPGIPRCEPCPACPALPACPACLGTQHSA